MLIQHPLTGDMSGRVGDLSPKQAEALEQVHDQAFFACVCARSEMHQDIYLFIISYSRTSAD